MGNGVAERMETLPCSFKMHSSMCTRLKNLVARIMKIFPDIEDARPRCSSGIQALCLLNHALEKARLLLKYCNESSKLYMAITGDAIISRGCRAKNLLVQSLSEIQSLVPVVLAVKISQVIQDLRSAVFTADASEEEAGKAVRGLMRQNSSLSVSSLEMRNFHFVARNLQLSTHEAILIEKRSLKGLLDKFGESDVKKRNILKYLLYLLKKHESVVNGDKKENSCPQHEESFADRNSRDSSVCANATEAECSEEHKHRGDESDPLGSAMPPEEFFCPLSQTLMCDPVIISSGQTFERMWIQKWFDEGNDSCPKTKMKLDNFLLIPNKGMKDLISKWTSKYGVEIEDPLKQSRACRHWDFSSASIASFGSSMCNLRLPSDLSSVIGGSDASYSGEATANAKISKGSSFMPMQTIDDDSATGLSDTSHSEVDLELLRGLAKLPWDAQSKVVEDLRKSFKNNSRTFRSMSPQKFVEPLITYLKEAHDLNGVEYMRAGLELLLSFLTKNRRAVDSLGDDAFHLVSLLLQSEVAEEALNIIEVLSTHPYGQSKIASAGSLASLMKILESRIQNLEEQAIITLQNLSSSNDICLEMVSLQFIQKLTCFLQHNFLAKHCIVILENLCNTEKGRASVTETTGCLASISELLEFGTPEEQENAVAILLLLCVQKIEYCYRVVDEGINVIPSLFLISNNGNEKAKVSASELLRILQDIDFGEEQRSFASAEQTVPEDVVGTSVSTEPTPSPKKSSRLRFKLPGLKKKR